MESPRLRWALLLGGALAWRLALFVGPQASDDLAYSNAAWDLISEGRLTHGIHGLRLGYVGIMGLFYALAGAGSFTLVLLNLVASVAEIALVRLVAREFLDDAGSWLAAGLVALLPVHVFQGTEAHPDVPLAALTTLSALLLLRGERLQRPGLLVAAGLALGAAHLMKESAFFGLAALVALAGRPAPRHLRVLAGFAAVLAVEAGFFWIATGDPFHRYHVVKSLQASIMSSEFYLQSAPTVRRMLLDTPSMLLWPGDGGYFSFALLPLAALAGAGMALWRRDRPLRGPALWAMALIALPALWPISLSPFRPAMVVSPGIFLPAAAPLAILAAFGLRAISSRLRWPALGLIVPSFLALAVLLHLDGRYLTQGAQLAYEATRDRTVRTDPRTADLFRLYDGYAKEERVRDWDLPPPAVPYDLVINGTSIRLVKEWYGFRPPADFTPGGGETILRQTIAGRQQLRGLRTGRDYPTAVDDVTVIRYP